MFFEYKGTIYNPLHAIKVGKVASMSHGSGIFTVVFLQIGEVKFQYGSVEEAMAARARFTGGAG